MTKNELIRATAAKAGTTIKDAKVVVEALLETVTNTLADGDDIVITGFGTFNTTIKEAHEARNPQNNETVSVPAKRVAKFKFSKVALEALNA